MPVIHARLPEFAEHYRDALERCGAEAPSLRAAAEAHELLQTEGWEACPGWREILQGARPAPPEHTGPGDWPHGWQFHASRTRNQHLRDSLMLPAMTPDARALVTIPIGAPRRVVACCHTRRASNDACAPSHQLALHRRLRMPLPICHGRCGPTHGCGAQADRLGDHALACPRTGLLARRAKVVERAWVRVAREAVGAEGQVVPQQWLVHTTAPGVRAEDRRRLDLVIAQRLRAVLRCDTGIATNAHGTTTARAQGPRSSSCLEAKSEGASTAMRTVWYETWFGYGLTEALRAAGASGWTRRWWGMLSVAVQQAVASIALGQPWPQPPNATSVEGPPLDRVLDLAEAEGPSRLPLRPQAKQ